MAEFLVIGAVSAALAVGLAFGYALMLRYLLAKDVHFYF